MTYEQYITRRSSRVVERWRLIVNGIRSLRGNLGIPHGQVIKAAGWSGHLDIEPDDAMTVLGGVPDETKEITKQGEDAISTMCWLSGFWRLTIDSGPEWALTYPIVVGFIFHLPKSALDLKTAQIKVEKSAESLMAEINMLSKTLGNPQFVDRANPEVVAERALRLEVATADHAKLIECLRVLVDNKNTG